MEQNFMVDLNEVAHGTLATRFNEELKRVLENIADPNTDADKKRTITITVNVAGDQDRDVLYTDIVVRSKLQPARPATTKLMMGVNPNGNMTASELKSGAQGQMYIDTDSDLAHDTGQKVDEHNQVIDLRKHGGND